MYNVKEKGEQPYTPFLWFKKSIQKPEVLKTLKILLRNLNEILRSWIRLQYKIVRIWAVKKYERRTGAKICEGERRSRRLGELAEFSAN